MLLSSFERFGDRTAIVWRDRRWTYSELHDRVRRAEGLLSGLLVDDRSRLMIAADNHPSYVVAYSAAQAIGRCTVEIGRHESLETLRKIVGTTRPGYVLTDREDFLDSLAGEVPAGGVESFLERLDSEARPGSPAAGPADEDRESRTASIIYTSGTTGLPKGVVLSQGNFCFVVAAIVDYLGLDPNDRYGLMLPLSHSYGKSNLLTTFAAGASLVFLDEFQNLPAFVERTASERVTILSAVPYHAHILLKRASLSGRDLSNLRAITFSGNKLPPATIDGLSEALPRARIFSMYGLTESCTRACYVPPDLLSRKKESCGRPLPGVEIRIRDDSGRDLGPGEVGHILLRGPNVMTGYFQDPELTGRTLEDGWLRTGDLGKLDAEGFLFLEGREKDIIKCAGERISPAEIEDVLGSHPRVADVAVVGSPDPVLGEVIHAFVVPRDRDLDPGELRTYSASRLSHHKLPRRFTMTDQLPRTATGKIRKHLLTES
jgi:acyl-CoA synthetase (AMP-forming)/AMP-acid ligase II